MKELSWDYVVPNGKVAILLATYNGEKYIEEQLESIEKQTFQNFICFIHDDGSTDCTVEIVNGFCKKYPEQFVFMGNMPTGGAKYNFMYMLSKVRADYIMFCDQDDVWMPEKIEFSFGKIRELEGVYGNIPLCAYSDVIVADEQLNTICESYYKYSSKDPYKNRLSDLMYVNVLVGCTMIINHCLQCRALSVNEIDKIFMHDWWIALLCSCEGEMEYIDKQLSYYRQHGDNTVGAKKSSDIHQKIYNMLHLKRYLEMRHRRDERRIDFAKALLAVLDPDNVNTVYLRTFVGTES